MQYISHVKWSRCEWHISSRWGLYLGPKPNNMLPSTGQTSIVQARLLIPQSWWMPMPATKLRFFINVCAVCTKYSKGLHNAHMTIVTRLKTETRMNQYFHQPQTSTIKLVNVVFRWLNMAQYKYYLFASLLDDWVPAARETELVECIGRALHKVGVLKFAPAVCALQQWCPISLSKNSGARKRPEYNHLLSTQHHPWPHCLSLTPGRVGYPADIDTP